MTKDFLNRQIKILRDKVDLFAKDKIDLNTLTNYFDAIINVLDVSEDELKYLQSLWWRIEETNAYLIDQNKPPNSDEVKSIIKNIDTTIKYIEKIPATDLPFY